MNPQPSSPPSLRRIAMWSPPRARSTMMMRVFEALGCAVFDEPFYAYWLKTLNKTDDPGYRETLAHHETDWRRIVDLVLGPIPDGREWYYQKHMAIHMLEEVDLGWMREVRNGFLIRDPAEVIASMSAFRALEPRNEADVAAAAQLVGIPQLRRIFDRACDIAGGPPPVIDANDVLRDPARILGGFCAAVGMDFDPDVPLRWAPGRHPQDGAWADAWYGKVYETTGLGPYRPKKFTVPAPLQPLVDYCRPTYAHIAQYRIT
jgi:hypothetical protein